ncbi:MAG: BON domain-containing protein [Chryseosolibacter sp.]
MKSDIEIREDVLEEIRWDPQVTKIAPRIGVTVKDEVVTLSGTVDFYFQRLAAEDAAQRVAGVKVVAVDIEVKGAGAADAVSDTRIAEAVRNALTWHSAVNEDLINIKVDNGWVYLEGTVHWDYERKAAEKAVENLIGVKGVINKVKIKTRVVAPADIKKEIRAAFQRNATVDASAIAVEVSESTIKLTGRVRSWAEKNDAALVARSMPGVTNVENLLEVTSGVYASAPRDR